MNSQIKKVNMDKSYKSMIRQKGLTIVESLVAISILVVSVLGPLVIVSQAFKISFFARDQMTGFYLAQEAIEYVRNIRDKNSLTVTDPNLWLSGLIDGGLSNPIINDASDTTPDKYQLVRDSSGYKLKLCPGTPSVCPKIKLNSTNGLYGEDTTTGTKDSIFTREVIFTKSPEDTAAVQEISVKFLMKWNQVGGTYQFPLHLQLTNWKIQNYEGS